MGLRQKKQGAEVFLNKFFSSIIYPLIYLVWKRHIKYRHYYIYLLLKVTNSVMTDNLTIKYLFLLKKKGFIAKN
jgi:hypothetical protein